MTTFAVGNFMRFTPPTGSRAGVGDYYGSIEYAFQNFFIGKVISYDSVDHDFRPFGFSGATINKNGDGMDANLVFPNNALTRDWADKAVKNRWLARVDVVSVDPDSTTVTTSTRVHVYHGQVTGGKWDATALTLQLGSVLDAVGADVPRRNLTQRLVGRLPTTSNVRLR